MKIQNISRDSNVAIGPQNQGKLFMWPDSHDLRQSIHNINNHSSQIFANENDNFTQKETIIEQNNKRYFQKKLNDRRQRTYDVLK